MPSPASGVVPEVADDGGVGEQEERLGDQGQERRDREAQDLAVGGAGHGGESSHCKGHQPQLARDPTLVPGHLWVTPVDLWESGRPNRIVDKETGIRETTGG